MATPGTQKLFTHWKSLSLNDIQHTMDLMTSVIDSTAQTDRTRNTQKAYLCNLTRKHTWRNSGGADECEVQFYFLKPRRDIPAFTRINGTTLTNVLTITPPSVDAYGTGGTLADPPWITQGMLDWGAGTRARIAETNLAFTPFMCPALTRVFKIRPLKVSGPAGIKSIQRLLPGQECTFTGKFRKPYMCAMSKYAMQGSTTFTIGQMYEVLRETGVILGILKGTTSHDVTTSTLVDKGPAWLDYKQECRFEQWTMNLNQFSTTNVLTTSRSVIAAAEQTKLMTGNVEAEVQP